MCVKERAARREGGGEGGGSRGCVCKCMNGEIDRRSKGMREKKENGYVHERINVGNIYMYFVCIVIALAKLYPC